MDIFIYYAIIKLIFNILCEIILTGPNVNIIIIILMSLIEVCYEVSNSNKNKTL